MLATEISNTPFNYDIIGSMMILTLSWRKKTIRQTEAGEIALSKSSQILYTKQLE